MQSNERKDVEKHEHPRVLMVHSTEIKEKSGNKSKYNFLKYCTGRKKSYWVIFIYTN